ncbi:A-type cyclin [Seminavis robusta]|uniref:A-type cyclin n=1 Tax=Seminavis robusta TaxID=568900 RepID=A0A9N8DDL4_9STRA|nr:A-type cyclin [Seminavis robusta]|eukprot:Sro25_g016780.1 A-type cyclin (532) ;mRNA; r:33139-34830
MDDKDATPRSWQLAGRMDEESTPARTTSRSKSQKAKLPQAAKEGTAAKKRSSDGDGLSCAGSITARRKKARRHRSNSKENLLAADDKKTSGGSPLRSKKSIAISPDSLFTPNTAASTPASSSSNKLCEEDDSSLSRSEILATVGFPPKVPDLFAFPKHEPTSCQCHHFMTVNKPVCLGRCNTVAHLHNYGWEYKALLKNVEDKEYQDVEPQQLDDKDPYHLLTLSDIVPPPEFRTRQRTKWAVAMDWTLDGYMDRQPDMENRMRGILMDWIIELSEEYKLSPMTFHLAVTLIDKSMACTPTEEEAEGKGMIGHGMTIPRDMLQCLGCACTWIAAKMEETHPPSVDDFVYISDNIYRRGQILDMELDVCSALKFHLQHVTPVHYAHEYLLASQGGPCRPNSPTGPAFHSLLRNMVHYLLELSRVAYELVPVKPSLVAAATVFLARATLGICNDSVEEDCDEREQNKFWNKTLQCYTGYSVEELKDTVQVLHRYHQKAESSQLKAAFTKYSKSKYMHVAHKTVLREEDLELEV